MLLMGLLHEGYREGRKKKAPLRRVYNRRITNSYEESAAAASVRAMPLSSRGSAFVTGFKNFKAFPYSPTIIWTHLSSFKIAGVWEPLLL